MAREGWHLASDGIFCGVAQFERGEPKTVRYRLAAAKESTSIWTDGSGRPDEEQVETGAALGWEYVGNRGEFHIFRSADPAALELDTDPQVQALALEAVRKRQRSNQFFFALWPIFYFLLHSKGSVFLAAVHAGSGLVLALMGSMLWSVVSNLREYFFLRALKKRLEAGESLDHGKDWRSRKGRYFAGRAAGWTVVILLVVALTRTLMVSGEKGIPLTDYVGHPPFVTLYELHGEGEGIYWRSDLSTVREWSDLISPVNLDWSEYATVTYTDGTELGGALCVDYHETVSPWVARLLAQEYQRWDRWGNRWNWEHYEELECPPMDVDWAVAYRSIYPTVVFQKGNVVVRAYGYGLPLEDWAPKLADSIQ